jgi:hypothetical protein
MRNFSCLDEVLVGEAEEADGVIAVVNIGVTVGDRFVTDVTDCVGAEEGVLPAIIASRLFR